MTSQNPQIESQLDALAKHCLAVFEGDETTIDDRTEALLRSLLMSGYSRNAETTLQTNIENRVVASSQDMGLHHRREISAVAKKIQEKFDKMELWESNKPQEYPPAKSENISSATDA